MRTKCSCHRILVSMLLLLFSFELSRAETVPEIQTEKPVVLEPINVTAPRIPTPITRVPAAVTAVEKEEIQRGRPAVAMDEPLMRVPGVFVQNRYNFAQDLRISIRGFGSRAAFGIRGVKILVDGIPLTLPDGQTQIDAIDPLVVERMEVLRGPASALYGNASGGVINIVTEDGPPEPYVEAGTVHGDDGLWKTHLEAGGEAGKVNYLFNASRLEYDGYREHSRAERNLFTGKIRYEIDAASELTALINYVNIPVAEGAGGLTEEMAAADRRQAAPINLGFDTREEIEQARLGLVYDRLLSKDSNLQVTGFYTRRELENAIPFTFIELDRDFAGGGVKYNHTGEVFGRENRITIGVDGDCQIDDRYNFNNVAGEPGDEVELSQEETVIAAGPYIQEKLAVTEKLSLFFGGRYDWVRFEVDDRLLADGDDSGNRTFEEFTGRMGFLYTFVPEFHLYGNISESFETPTTTELVNQPENPGGLNPDIEPQEAVNYELGMKGIFFDEAVFYQVSLFDIELDDELIAFRGVDDDRVFFRNAGESYRRGVEAGLEAESESGLSARFSYTFMEAEFEDYVKDGVNLDGNDVPGLPDNMLFGEIAYTHPGGAFAAIDATWAGELYADDENTVETDAYTVVNLRFNYEKKIASWNFRPFFGISNLFDEEYNSNVRINARSDRFFEPAPERNYYGGIRVSYGW